MKNLSILYLILTPFISFAQAPKIDSLQQALITYDAKKGEQRINPTPDISDSTKVLLLKKPGSGIFHGFRLCIRHKIYGGRPGSCKAN